jgi:hypothetical protein
MGNTRTKKSFRDSLIKLAIRLGAVTEREVQERLNNGLPWNVKPKK